MNKADEPVDIPEIIDGDEKLKMFFIKNTPATPLDLDIDIDNLIKNNIVETIKLPHKAFEDILKYGKSKSNYDNNPVTNLMEFNYDYNSEDLFEKLHELGHVEEKYTKYKPDGGYARLGEKEFFHDTKYSFNNKFIENLLLNDSKLIEIHVESSGFLSKNTTMYISLN